MKIESIIKREGGTLVTLDGEDYHFKPDATGAHVAEVTKNKHVQKFLAVPEGFRIAGAEDDTEIPEDADLDAGDSKTVDPNADDGAEGDDESGDDEGDGEPEMDREELAEQFKEKFGNRPHGKWDAKRIWEELQAAEKAEAQEANSDEGQE